MKKIFLIRHPEIEEAAAGRFYGHTDVGLSPNGLKQAELLVKRLAQEKIDLVYSSDLFRARHVAGLLAQKFNIQHKSQGEWREINLGEWEGLTFQEIEKSYPILCKQWFEETHNFKFPHGESVVDFFHRLRKEYYSVLAESKSNNVAVITHSGVIRVLLCEILELEIDKMWRIWIDFGSISIISYPLPSDKLAPSSDFSKYPIVLTINEAGYLKNR